MSGRDNQKRLSTKPYRSLLSHYHVKYTVEGIVEHLIYERRCRKYWGLLFKQGWALWVERRYEWANINLVHRKDSEKHYLAK